MRQLRFLTAFVLALTAAGAAGAASIPFGMTVSLGDDTFTVEQLEALGLVGRYPTAKGEHLETYAPYTHQDTTTGEDDWLLTNWESEYDVDPFVTNNLSVTNLSGVTQIFSVTVLSPVTSTAPFTTLMDGSIGISLTSAPTIPGAMFSSALSTAVYTARIDGVSVQTLANDPYSLSCAGSTCSASANFDFGNPFPIPGPVATTSIGITIQFALSPGDSAAVTSVFNIVAVPEPTTLLLLGSGLAGIAFLAPRRRA